MLMNKGSRIADGFMRHFEIKPAHEAKDLDEVFFIRHEVYCSELGFEPENERRRESDQYDEYSLHCLIRSVGEAGSPVGCSRLVLVPPDRPEALLPFEEICREEFASNSNSVNPQDLPRKMIGEFSRLAVLPDFRFTRSRSRSGRLPADGEAFHAPAFPYILFGLYLGTVALAWHHGIEYIFTLTELRLIESLAQLDIGIQTIGPAVEHRGQRTPSLVKTSTVIEKMPKTVLPLWIAISTRIGEACARKGRSVETVTTGL